MHRSVIAFAFVAVSGSAYSDSLKTMQVANELGAMLASEKICEITFDQSAIEKYIDKHVDASDMSFASMLSTMTSGQEFQINGMSASSKTAHCAQIRRSAKAQGLLSK